MAQMKAILVVDDEPVSREGLGVILRRAGYEIILASNGEEALAVLRRQRPDLILLDMLMPVLDGWHFLERLHDANLPPSVPILVVTAAMSLTREWARDHGCCGCLRKPIGIEQMVEEIRRCLEERQTC